MGTVISRLEQHCTAPMLHPQERLISRRTKHFSRVQTCAVWVIFCGDNSKTGSVNNPKLLTRSGIIFERRS